MSYHKKTKSFYIYLYSKWNFDYINKQSVCTFQVYASTQQDVTVADVTSLFKSKYSSIDLEDVFGEDSDYDVGRMLSQEFVEKAGIISFPQVSLYICTILYFVHRQLS